MVFERGLRYAEYKGSEHGSEKMIYTVCKVSKILGVNRNCVYNLINHGILKTIKLGRQKITYNSLMEFLNNYDGYDLTDLANIKCIHEYKSAR